MDRMDDDTANTIRPTAMPIEPRDGKRRREKSEADTN